MGAYRLSTPSRVAFCAALLLVSMVGCRKADTSAEPAAEEVAAEGLTELEAAMSDATVTDVAASEPATRPPGDEGPAAVDPLAGDYPEAPVADTAPTVVAEDGATREGAAE